MIKYSEGPWKVGGFDRSWVVNENDELIAATFHIKHLKNAINVEEAAGNALILSKSLEMLELITYIETKIKNPSLDDLKEIEILIGNLLKDLR